jgi:alkanesulfonate monooxygenase SsuD/methylene tetrahydromethanopterin reductase-like flavin-dependent oxidoreductase (luciferase family)
VAALTEGRFHLCVANGRWRHDAELFGYDFDQRGARLAEGVRALQAIWRGEHTFAGRFWSWSVDAGEVTPCTSVPPPELWIAGEGEVTIRRALKYGLAWMPTRFKPDDLAPLARQYFDGGGLGLKVRMRMSVVQPPRTPDDSLAAIKLIGPTSFLAEHVHAYQQLGASYLSIVPGFDFASSAATIEALGQIRSQLG